MSYFSENPEAYDDISIRGICDRLLVEAGIDATEDQYEFLKAIVENLYIARVPVKPGDFNQFLNVTDALLDWSHEQRLDQERRFWDSKVP